MTSTSAIVNRSLRKHISPVLRQHGFEKVDARNGWRWVNKVILVFNIRAVGKYFSDVTGWPPGSVGVSLGAFYTFVPAVGPLKFDKQNRLVPPEYQCHMRKELETKLPQNQQIKALSNPAEKKRKDIWWIERDGSNADLVAAAIANSLVAQGMPWFSHVSDLNWLIKEVENERDCFNKFEKAAFLSKELGDTLRWEKYAALAEEEAKRIDTKFDPKFIGN